MNARYRITSIAIIFTGEIRPKRGEIPAAARRFCLMMVMVMTIDGNLTSSMFTVDSST